MLYTIGFNIRLIIFTEKQTQNQGAGPFTFETPYPTHSLNLRVFPTAEIWTLKAIKDNRRRE